MKTRLCLVLAILASCTFMQAQTTIFLTFTATNNTLYQPLDSILIQNLTQGGDTTLYSPDTVLVLNHGIGIEDNLNGHGNQMILFPAYPNPITRTSTIRLWLPQEAPVTLRLYDLPGRELATFSRSLGAGEHAFTFNPGRETCYLLVAEAASERQVQKLINLNPGEVKCRLAYSGLQASTAGMRKGRAVFPWVPGDYLRFVGFSAAGVDTISDNPGQSNSYVFQIPLKQPVAAFLVSDSTLQINDTVFFTDISSGNPANWKWYFGDGDSSQQQHPFHTYHLLGMYTVTMIVSSPGGADTITRNNLITVGSGGSGSPCPGMPVVFDFNGNVYNTVQIGNQCWMQENLQARHYSNGTAISEKADFNTWLTWDSGARCWYNNDSATYAATYGSLYNWFAVNDTNGLCPAGWHVASDADWTILTGFLGGVALAGGPLKEAGTVHWVSPNTGATNSSGFTALPGGNRFSGNFHLNGGYGFWWSSTALDPISAWHRRLNSGSVTVVRTNDNKGHGYSVRCVKD